MLKQVEKPTAVASSHLFSNFFEAEIIIIIINFKFMVNGYAVLSDTTSLVTE